VAACGPWMRPQVSEKILAKTARSLPNGCAFLGPDVATAEASKEELHLVGLNNNVFGG
jgi:hypothetical protein